MYYAMCMNKTKKEKEREARIARSNHAHRNDTAPDSYWSTVIDILNARDFYHGYESNAAWIKQMTRDKITPEQVLEYAQHVGIKYYWKELAAAKVTNLAAWFLALGLEEDVQFRAWEKHMARDYIPNIIKWTMEGYTPAQVGAWRAIGLTPDEVEDKEKTVVVILD